MVQAILECIKRARNRDYRVECEVDAGVGIADIVLCKRARNSSRALRALAGITPRLAVLLDREVGTSVTSIGELAACIGASKSSAQRLLSQLYAAGLARPTSIGFAIASVATPPFQKIIAVEAKLSNWQHALVQAYRNFQFADESWVVLDHRFARPAIAQIDRFKTSGVGLVSIDRALGLFVHHTADNSGPVSLGKRWQAQAVLASRSKNSLSLT